MPDDKATLSPNEVHDLFERFSGLMSQHAEATRLYEEILDRLDERSGDPKELGYIHFIAGHGYAYGPPPYDIDLALAAWKRALALDPGNGFYGSNFIIVCENNNAMEELLPVAQWMKDFGESPVWARESHQSIIYALACLADPVQSPLLTAEIGHWAARYVAPQAPSRTSYRRRPGRPLRVGFIHNFFDRAAYHGLLIPLLQQMDRKRVISHCYSTCRNDEAVAPDMRDAAHRWRPLEGMSEDQIHEVIAGDALDILINLDGFHPSTCFEALARRPAPIMATWHNTSHTFGGLFDYIIADEIVLPAEHASFFSETVLRTSGCYFVMETQVELPARGPLPATGNGYVTFGSMNRPGKLSKTLLGSWSRILAAVPKSRLLLRNIEYSDTNTNKQVLSNLLAAGIQPDRIIILGSAENYEFVDTYNRIDIALDTFPFCGGTTTYQALWMGVPTVTYLGDRWAGRVSASILTYAGLPELIASSQDGYEALAIALANEPYRLEAVRARIAEIERTGSALKTATFAQDMMDAFERMAADFEARTASL